MIQAKKFFFFSETTISEKILCDFERFDGQMILKFWHENDTFRNDCLTVTIDSKQVETANASYRDHFISYNLTRYPAQTIKQAKSSALPADLVWGAVVAIVNDSFAN